MRKLKPNNDRIPVQQGINFRQRACIKEEYKILYNKHDTCNIFVKVVHSKLSYRLHPPGFDTLDSKVREHVASFFHKKKPDS